MPPVVAMATGFVATLGLLALAAPVLPPAISSPAAVVSASDGMQSVDRSLKGDRLAGPRVEQQRLQPKSMPVRTLQEDTRKSLEGCDPLVSPLVGSSLSKVAGRCIAWSSTGQAPA